MTTPPRLQLFEVRSEGKATREDVSTFSSSGSVVIGNMTEFENKVDLWLVWYKKSPFPPALDILKCQLDKRSTDGEFTYRLVAIQDLVIGIQNGKPVIYLHNKKEENFPKVAFIYISGNPILASHIVPSIRHLEIVGIRCVNSSMAHSICLSKLEQMQRLVHADIPMPDTLTYATFTKDGLPSVLKVPKGIDFPAILKLAGGSSGKRVMLIPIKETVQDIACSLNDDNLYLLQQYIKESHGTHVRVMVVGGRVHGFYRNTNTSNNRVQSNRNLGGKREKIEGNEDFEELSVKIANILGLEIAGIDFVEDSEGRKLFLEANSSPGFKCDDTIADTVIDFLLKCKDSC